MKINMTNLNRKERHELIMSAIVPRPIAWVSTIGENGVFNIAPFSAFSSLSLKPALLCFSVGWKRNGERKDTIRNIEFTKDFVINVVDESLSNHMNLTSKEYASDIDEFKQVELTPVKADIVKSPMIAQSVINIECKLFQILKFGEAPDGAEVVIGEMVLFHIKDDLWNNSHIEPEKLRAIGRIGGPDSYCRTTDIFKMPRPY